MNGPKEKFDIMVRSKSSQDQIASYLVRILLALRDRYNKQNYVRILGSGQAIPIVILIAEVIRQRIKNLCSINGLEIISKKRNGIIYTIPAIIIKLTTQPTKLEKCLAGYQQPNNIEDNKHVELFDYTMMYIENIYFWKSGRNDTDIQQKEVSKKNNQKSIKIQEKYFINRTDDKDPSQSDNWNKDRIEFQEKEEINQILLDREKENYQSRKRGEQIKRGSQRQINRVSKLKIQQQSEISREGIIIKRGEIKKRGLIRK